MGRLGQEHGGLGKRVNFSSQLYFSSFPLSESLGQAISNGKYQAERGWAKIEMYNSQVKRPRTLGPCMAAGHVPPYPWLGLGFGCVRDWWGRGLQPGLIQSLFGIHCWMAQREKQSRLATCYPALLYWHFIGALSISGRGCWQPKGSVWRKVRIERKLCRRGCDRRRRWNLSTIDISQQQEYSAIRSKTCLR